MKNSIRYFALCFFFLLAGYSFGQKNNKELKKANILYDKNDYINAYKAYVKIYKKDSTLEEINYRLGVCMYNQRERKMEALPFFEKCNNQQYPSAVLNRANLYHLAGKFDEALKDYAEYNKVTDSDDSVYIQLLMAKSLFAKQMMKTPLNVKINNMGNKINSPYPDYVPLLSADGSTLIFTSRRSNSTGGLKDLNGEYMEDIYISYKSGSEWSEPVSISKNINTELHDACVALSPDGQQLIVYQPSEDLMSGDLYLSRFTGKDWTKPEILGSDINIDDAIEASATFSQDNSMLIFSSDRPGGFGGKDLYKVVKLPNGEWSKAQNLGSTINTAYHEDGPFLHMDGKTLYFSSESHDNMGGYDIFKSILNDAGTWTNPENLGYPINTVNDDIYFVLSVNGNQGYFSSQENNTTGGTDIYSINIPGQNFGLSVVSCKISGNDNVPMQATITLTENESEKLSGIYKSSKETGKFIMIISPGRKYTMDIQAEGYSPDKRELIFNNQDFEDNVTRLELKLTKLNSQ